MDQKSQPILSYPDNVSRRSPSTVEPSLMTRNRIADPSQESRERRGILSPYDQCLEESPPFFDRWNRTGVAFAVRSRSERRQVGVQRPSMQRHLSTFIPLGSKIVGSEILSILCLLLLFFLSSRTTNSSVLPDRAVILHDEKEKAWVCV